MKPSQRTDKSGASDAGIYRALSKAEEAPTGEIVKENNLGMDLYQSHPMKGEPLITQGEGDQPSIRMTEGDAMEFMSFDDRTYSVKS